ncbi:MBL fold metallo-hydrolase [Anaerostipes caccae]|uniref:MBL fold metallo-hydrolase n=1 Tax=Anaerostipes caccae TaxID=105841 RepID=UPI00101B90F7|nr:MBL fold metallo-hydrolase [Anaerostipes caccae]
MNKFRSLNLERIIVFMLCFLLGAGYFLNTSVSTHASSGGWKSQYYEISSADGTKIRFETLTNKGDSTLITFTKGSSKKYALVDTGIQAANVADTLVKKGIKRINYLILTHNDGDHINGLKNFKSKGIKVSYLYYNYIASKGEEPYKNYNLLEYVKNIKTSVITGSATRIRDAENHSSTAYNINMDNDSYLKVCRGRLYKLSKTSDSKGYDFIIIPPITDNIIGNGSWSVNNASMMVVVQTATDRVILGGDIQATAMDAINKYKDNTMIKMLPNDAYSYYYGIENYIFNSNTNRRYTAYKVSHHGTGSNRKMGASDSIKAVEQKFITSILPDALVLTGYNTEKPDIEYFQYIFNSAKRYSIFGNKGL